MSFNWRGATAGLLGEGGRQLGIGADKLGRLEEKKLQDSIDTRREQAKLTREKSLQVLGYSESGAPVTRQEYESIEGEKPPLYERGLGRDKPVVDKGPQSAIGKKYKDLTEIVGKEKALDIIKDEIKGKKAKVSAADQKWLYVQEHGSSADKLAAAGGLKPDKPKVTKPDYTQGQALEKIANVDKQIGKIQAGERVDDKMFDEMKDIDPLFAGMFGNKKDMSPEDKKKVIASLIKFRNHLTTFLPESKPSVLLNDDMSNYEKAH